MEARANNDRHRQRQQKLKEQVDTRVAAATEKKGILIVFTGNGKGKSTAAFGTATRAVGHGKTVGIAQFIKGQWDNGEYNTLQPLGVEFHIMGTGFTRETQNRQADIEAATVVWQESKRMLADAHYDQWCWMNSPTCWLTTIWIRKRLSTPSKIVLPVRALSSQDADAIRGYWNWPIRSVKYARSNTRLTAVFRHRLGSTGSRSFAG